MFPSPAIEPPELQNFQFEYNGVVIGAGTPYAVLNIDGLDLAEIRSGDVSWPRDHGQAKGLDLYGGRDIIFDVWMKSDGTSLQSAQLALAAATVVLPFEELPLWFQLPNLPLLCIMCRPRKKLLKVESDYAAANIGHPELSLHAADPRIYAAGVETGIEPGKTAKLNNSGNTEMRPILIITGPMTRPKAGNETIAGKPFLEMINPKAEEEERVEKETDEAEEKAAQEKREGEEAAAVKLWEEERLKFEITFEQFEEKVAAQKVAREAAVAAEAAAVIARVKAEKEALELREKEEHEGKKPTVKAGDQMLIDLGTPHIVQYYPGGITKNEPVDASGWVAPGSVWWDLILGENTVAVSSFDTAPTGTVAVQWAPALEL
jgi:hypothetical protein